jgi:hypothetical protein
MKILHLSLKKEPFDIMVTGEKKQEFRKYSKWIQSRIFDKDNNIKNYDLIKFVNGYGKDKPYFICRFNGVKKSDVNIHIEYSNGLIIKDLAINDYTIELGDIVEYGNLKINKQK